MTTRCTLSSQTNMTAPRVPQHNTCSWPVQVMLTSQCDTRSNSLTYMGVKASSPLLSLRGNDSLRAFFDLFSRQTELIKIIIFFLHAEDTHELRDLADQIRVEINVQNSQAPQCCPTQTLLIHMIFPLIPSMI